MIASKKNLFSYLTLRDCSNQNRVLKAQCVTFNRIIWHEMELSKKNIYIWMFFFSYIMSLKPTAVVFSFSNNVLYLVCHKSLVGQNVGVLGVSQVYREKYVRSNGTSENRVCNVLSHC